MASIGHTIHARFYPANSRAPSKKKKRKKVKALPSLLKRYRAYASYITPWEKLGRERGSRDGGRGYKGRGKRKEETKWRRRPLPLLLQLCWSSANWIGDLWSKARGEGRSRALLLYILFRAEENSPIVSFTLYSYINESSTTFTRLFMIISLTRAIHLKLIPIKFDRDISFSLSFSL